MDFYSINNKSHKASFAQAMINGLTPDKGLYFPSEIPQFPKLFFESLPDLSLAEVAHTVLLPYVKEDIPSEDLRKITEEVFNFEIPLVSIEPGIYSLELFHGPTLAFKDVGARFLAQAMQYLNHGKTIRVLVATSGDTGSAVANGFLGIEGTQVIVLYPKGKVSELQQKQFATLGQNIIPVAIEGTFDDCQRLVKQAFADESIYHKMNLTSANSINVARWIPQSVYYYWAIAQLKNEGKQVIVSVPSGNLGNLTSGILAMKTGLKTDRFIAVSNINDIVPEYISTGIFNPQPSVQTIANAMDVGNPNNFPRLLELFDNDYQKLRQFVYGKSFSDDRIREIILGCYSRTGYLLDPHGATGYGALKEYAHSENVTGIFLATAHPGKFNDEMERIVGKKLSLPQRLQKFTRRNIQTENLGTDYKAFRQFLTDITNH